MIPSGMLWQIVALIRRCTQHFQIQQAGKLNKARKLNKASDKLPKRKLEDLRTQQPRVTKASCWIVTARAVVLVI